jgi:multidrug efflux pump subunit AcrB
MLVIIGTVFFTKIPVELTPDVSLPSITVNYFMGRTSPVVMEQEVTRKVESAANQLRNVENITSRTEEGHSSVTISFSRSDVVDFRMVELSELLSALRDDLPASVQQRPIQKSIPDNLEENRTFLSLSVTGEQSRSNLSEFARKELQIPINGMNGVGDVTISGVREPVLAITFDESMLRRYQVSVSEIQSRIISRFKWNPAGIIRSSGNEWSLVIPPAFTSPAEIEQFPISVADDVTVPLCALASVSVRDYPVKSLRRVNGNPSITLTVTKEIGADALLLSDQIYAFLNQVRAETENITIRVDIDNTKELREQLADLENQSRFSLVFVFLVLLIFIREWKAPLTILGSIVLSLLLSVSVLYLLDYTLNMFTLAALTISIGMLVDNAIVVYEHLHKNLPESHSDRLNHVVSGLPHVVVPVLGNTLTTIGIFIPLLFTIRSLLYFLEPLGVALTITLLASVVVSLTWIPYVLIWLAPASKSGTKSALLQKWRSFSPSKILKKNLRRSVLIWFYWRQKLRWVILAILLLGFGLPLYLIPHHEPNPSMTQSADQEKDSFSLKNLWFSVRSEYEQIRDDIEPWLGGISYQFYTGTYFGEGFSRDFEERDLTVYIRTPVGSPLEEIDKIVKRFEAIATPYSDELDYIEARVSEYFGGSVVYRFKEGADMRPAPYMLKSEASYLAARTGNTGISVYGFGEGFSTSLHFGVSYNFRVQMSGYSSDQLRELSLELKRRLQKNSRIRSVDINLSNFFRRGDMYRYVIRLNDAELARRGLTRRAVVQELQPEINTENLLGRIEFQGEPMFVMTQIVQPQQKATSDLMSRPRQINGQNLNLNEIASLQKERINARIDKNNQEYTRTIGIEYLGAHRFGKELIEEVISEFPVPPGVRLEIPQGFRFGDEEDKTFALWALLLAAPLIIWLITASLLESWRDARVILAIIPLSLTGLMGITLFEDLAFGQAGWSAALLLAGIAVNNGILLLHRKKDYELSGINGVRKWWYVYKDSSRAVLLTTLTTIAGLLPMLLWRSNEFWYTLAQFIIWGLVASTLLILLFMGSWEKREQF